MASQYNGIKLDKAQWDSLRAIVAPLVTPELESTINGMMDAVRESLPKVGAPAGYTVTIGTVLTMAQQVITGKGNEAEKSLKALLADPANHAKLLAFLSGNGTPPANSADVARDNARKVREAATVERK